MDIAIIGGGPAGMMAAIAASKNKNNKVFLIEKNEKLGKKLFITGKGRCNVTNACDILEFKKNIIHNEKFMNSSLSKFSNKDFIAFLNNNNCPTKIERGLRVFPISDKSYQITDCFKNLLKKQNVNILLNSNVSNIDLNNKTINNKQKFKISFVNKNKTNFLYADKIIIATGGISYKTTGSTGDGFLFAKKFDINVKNLKPALVPIRICDSQKTKKNILLKNISMKIISDNKIYYKDFGDLEFYNGGVKGPTILSASSYLVDYIDVNTKNFLKEFFLIIDLKPALTEKEIDMRIIKEIENNNKINLYNLYKKILPTEIISNFHISLNTDVDLNMEVYKIDKNFRKKIVSSLKNYVVKLIGFNDFNEAIITSGGIDCKEINPKTMESKKISGLYFVGEILDVDCLTGGFNISIAATTGYVAGSSINSLL